MSTREISGFHSKRHSPCQIFVYNHYDDSCWYVVEGKRKVCCTLETLEDGVDVSDLPNVDSFYWHKHIRFSSELEEAVNN